MSAIILNTLTGAVSEYDSFDFDSITPTHAGDAAGLYTLGGDLDLTNIVVSSIQTGKRLWSDSLKMGVEFVYFSLKGQGVGRLTVVGETDSYAYNFPVRDSGESRAQPGKGIRENYLAFGYSNPNGDDFELDRMEVLAAKSATRRVGR